MPTRRRRCAQHIGGGKRGKGERKMWVNLNIAQDAGEQNKGGQFILREPRLPADRGKDERQGKREKTLRKWRKGVRAILGRSPPHAA